jgi:hypothetical protein
VVRQFEQLRGVEDARGHRYLVALQAVGHTLAMIGTGSLLGFVLLAGVIAGIALRDTLMDTLPAPSDEPAKEAATARS